MNQSTVYLLMALCYSLDSCVGPLIYAFANTSYRAALLSLLAPLRHMCKRTVGDEGAAVTRPEAVAEAAKEAGVRLQDSGRGSSRVCERE